MTVEKTTSLSDIPGIASPAATALKAAGFTRIADLDGIDWKELSSLQGIGPATGARLQAHLDELGMHLLNPPAPRDLSATFTREHTGTSAPDIKTTATTMTPESFLAELSEKRGAEGHQLLVLFDRATGERPLMWGPSMIGYGESHYVYASGREGDTFHLGFSPRKASIALYGLQGYPRSAALLDKLGRHKTGAGCIWVNTLADIDLEILQELVAHAWGRDPHSR